MTLKELLWRPIHWPGTVYAWREPWLNRSRLRGDLRLRILIIIGVWALATGGLLMLFAINVSPPGIGVALALGFVFGGSPAALATLLNHRDGSAAVTIGDESIAVRRQGLFWVLLRTVWRRWPYPEVRRCTVIRRPVRGQAWSLLLLQHATKCEELVAVAARVNIDELVAFLAARGVSVTYEDHVPTAYTHGLGRSTAIGATAIGGVCLAVGLLYYVSRTPGVARWRMKAQVAATDARQRAELEREAKGQGAGESPAPTVQAEPERGPAGADRPPGAATSSVPGAPWAGKAPRGMAKVPGMEPPPGALPPSAEPAPPTEGQYDTQTAGGTGGTPFRTVSSEGKPVLGFSCGMGSWSGQQAVAALDPIWDRNAPPASGQVVLAKEGYAVGGLKVDGKDLVCAVKVVFLRVRPDGTLDRTDSYSSEWLGKPAGQAIKTVGGTGSKVVGVHGRRGAVLDAVGLVLAKAQKG